MKLISPLMIALCVASPVSAGGEMEFWKWFTANEERLYSFERDQEAIFDELAAELQRVHPDLTFEFGPVKSGARDFVVSAGGIKAAFPAVKSLVAESPALPNWRVIAFRPRRSPLNDIEIDGVSVKAAETRFSLIRHEGKLGVLLYMPGYSESQKAIFGHIGYLLLDEALGEYDVEMKLGVIEFRPLSGAHPEKSYPLPELTEFFDAQSS